MNPITALFKNHIDKEFNDNFFDTLEALMFLTKPSKESFSEIFEKKLANHVSRVDNSSASLAIEQLLNDTFESKNNKSNINPYFSHEDDDLSFSLNKKTQQNNTKTPNNIEYYNISDVLIIKLIENLKRLYAFSKAKDRSNNNNNPYNGLNNSRFNGYYSYNSPSPSTAELMNNQDSLLEQQASIYKVFSLLKNDLIFSKQFKSFEKAVLGNHINCFSMDLFAYLGTHEHLSPEHLDLHLSILEQHFPHDKKISQHFLSTISSLVHKPEKKPLLSFIFKHSDISAIIESTVTNRKTKHTWTVSILEYIVNPENNVELTFEDKKTFLNFIILNGFLDSYHIIDFFNDKSKYQQFLDNLNHLFSEPKLLPIFKQSVPHIPVNQLGNKTSSFVFNHIESLDDVSYFYTVLKNNDIDSSKKQIIFNLYNFDDINFLTKVVNLINQNTDINIRNNKMLEFMGTHDNVVSKELITYILTLDSSYMPICKSAYLKIRISESLNEKNNVENTSNAIKRNKI